MCIFTRSFIAAIGMSRQEEGCQGTQESMVPHQATFRANWAFHVGKEEVGRGRILNVLLKEAPE